MSSVTYLWAVSTFTSLSSLLFLPAEGPKFALSPTLWEQIETLQPPMARELGMTVLMTVL